MSLAAFSPKAARRNGEETNDASSTLAVTGALTPSSFSSSPTTMGQLVMTASPPPSSIEDTNTTSTKYQHLYVLPVLWLEFLAIALTRAVLPSILLDEYQNRVYLVLGCADCIRGMLAFLTCPLFGKLSDLWGRRLCLLITVMGSCAPVCSLAFFPWTAIEGSTMDVDIAPSNAAFVNEEAASLRSSSFDYSLPPMAIPLFVVLLSISGIFSSTFTLVFAYISDTVTQRDERVAAYGLALATFGLSFTIGPMAGGYLAQVNTQYVFLSSLALTLLDILYIIFILPESKIISDGNDRGSNVSTSSTVVFLRSQMADLHWSPMDSVRLVLEDPFLKKVGEVAFFYYTGLWAVISTLSLYAVQHFHLSTEQLGELMSALGLCTMIAEAVLVRIMVPMLGEKQSTKVGLVSFALQCFVLGAAYEDWHLFVCVAFSLLGNLVYPSLSSLVSEIVEPARVGEALGAMNGVKALTEGIGPLFFGALMTISESSAMPGWPYWVAGAFVLVAYKIADKLPDGAIDSKFANDDNGYGGEDYIHELEFKRRRRKGKAPDSDDIISCLTVNTPARDDQVEEYESLIPPHLSEVDESDEGERKQRTHTPRKAATGALPQVCLSFATPPKEDPTAAQEDVEEHQFYTPSSTSNR